MAKEIIKEYTNNDIKVFWKPDKCIHSKVCWKGLIQVFDPRNKPWVNIEGATSKRIMKQIDECPSAALSYEVLNAEKTSAANKTAIKCMENGPLLVMGEVHITNSDGKQETRSKATAFCRCGASDNKPYCDGKHTDINFVG